MNEVTNAKHYARKTKWIVTIIVAVAGAAAPMGSSIVLPALVDITREFHSTATIANLSVAMYMLAMSIFPLWWSSFSETLGRRTIYVVSFFLFLVFNVLAAVSTSMAMFIVMRLLSGGAAASVQAVGAGTIADVWEVKERGRAMGLFYLGPLCGPLLSPILGGVFAQTLGWRSAQWFLAIFAVLLWIFIVFALPETLPRVKLAATEVKAEAEAEAEAANTNEKREPRPPLTRSTTAQSVKVKSRQYLIMARRAFIDPLRIVLLLQFPAVAVLIAYASVTFAALYMLNISIQQTFSAAPYNYNAILIGCLYLPNSAGYILSSLLGGPWVDRIMDREARKAGRFDATHRLTYLPEDRMQENAWLGASIYPASLLAYGWFAHYHVHVAAALVANFFFGVGSMLIFALVTTMLTEFLPRKASSGIALNNFVRNIFSCVGSVVTEPLIVAVGNGWLFTGVTVIAVVVGGGTMWSMKYLGPKWRVAMDKRLEGVMGK
jgi:multidrug resistance protein